MVMVFHFQISAFRFFQKTQQAIGMEGLKQKKTVYLEALENLESKIKDLNSGLTAGGMKFFLLYLLYETRKVCEFFADVEKKVSEKVFTSDILEIDADVDYKDWSNNKHWKLNFDPQNIPEDSAFEPIEKTIWGMLDALPSNDSEQYVEFSRTDYKQVLQQILWSKCSNKQLFYALANLIKQLQITLCNIGDKQAKRDLSLEDGEKLYKGEEMLFNFSEAAKVVADFKKWKSDCEDDDEIILKRIEGKKLAEIKSFFDSGFLACKIEQQNEVDFSDYKEELDFNRLKGVAEGLNVEAYYSAMREFFKFNKGVLTPRKDKIGKFFFKHRKEVTVAHRVALFRFVKMLWLIEEEKKPKPKNEELNYEGIKVVMTRTHFPKCVSALCEGYNEEWLSNYMTALMESEHRDSIAKDWRNSAKAKQIYCAIIGVLKDSGVFKGSYASLAKMIYVGDNNEDKEEREKNLRTLSKYIGEGKNNIIGEWTEDYVNKV